MTNNDKHSSLPRYRINYDRKKFYDLGPASPFLFCSKLSNNSLPHWNQSYKDCITVINNLPFQASAFDSGKHL